MKIPAIVTTLLTLSVAVLPAAAGQPLFPAPTPMADANPNIREELLIQTPTKMSVERSPGMLVVTAMLTETKPVTITVGQRMITGLECSFIAYPKGALPPGGDHGFMLAGGTAFNNAHHIFNRNFGGVQEPGKSYVVEMHWKIFETDIPTQHMWHPQGGKYKVLLEGTVKQIVD